MPDIVSFFRSLGFILPAVLVCSVLSACVSMPAKPDFGSDVTISGVEETPNALIYEITWAAALDSWNPSIAYAVVPRNSLHGPGLLYFHQLGMSRDWQEFRTEALSLADRGVRSILLNGQAPWEAAFDGTANDQKRIDAQMVYLRRAVQLLPHIPGTDPKRLGFVGHDYGAMYGAMLSGEDSPIQSFALIAAAPEFVDWITYFSRDKELRDAYPSVMGDRSPVKALNKKPDVARLLQFSRQDNYISIDRAQVLAAANPSAKLEFVDSSSHDQVAFDGATSRLAWLFNIWGMRVPGPDLVPTIEVAGPTGNYRLGTTELTQAQWQSVMGTMPAWGNGANHPIEMVRWYDAVEFCNKLSALEGLPPAYEKTEQGVKPIPGSSGWRLPTSAEWEWAARGGKFNHKTEYAGSNNIDEVAWTWANVGEATHDVGQKLPNELGFYDMTGNVREWCEDIGVDETTHVFRGGGYLSDEKYLKLDYTDDFLGTFFNNDFGFRIARTIAR